MSLSSSTFSRDVARAFGERNNRSVSRRLADGLFGPAGGETGLDSVHQLMGTATAIIAATPQGVRGQAAILIGIGFLAAWVGGAPPKQTVYF